MVDALPQTQEQLAGAVESLDAELSRSLVLLKHLRHDPRPEMIAGYARETMELEALARKIGLTSPDTPLTTPPHRGEA